MVNNQDVDVSALEAETNEEMAVRLAEQAAEAFCGQCYLAHLMGADAWSGLAYLWGMSRPTVAKMADVPKVFTEDDFLPGAPLRIYTTAVEITRELWKATYGDEPTAARMRPGATHWLRLAVNSDYRKARGCPEEPGKIWSTRRMKEEAGVLQGKDESPVTFRGQSATVEEWDPARDRLTVTGAGISGEAPVRVKTAVTPLLEVREVAT